MLIKVVSPTKNSANCIYFWIGAQYYNNERDVDTTA